MLTKAGVWAEPALEAVISVLEAGTSPTAHRGGSNALETSFPKVMQLVCCKIPSQRALKRSV